MRIAILVYGRLNKCVEHYKNTVESIGEEHEVDFFVSSDNSEESVLNDFISLYKPVLYDNTKIIPNTDMCNYLKNCRNKRAETNMHNMICHFTNKKRVFNLLEQSKKTYDVIISLRIDLIFYNKFNFVTPDINTIYIPNCCDYVNNGINDQIAYGSMEVMEKYNNLISNILYLCSNNLSIPHPESLHYANLKFHKINIGRFNLSYIINR